MVLGFIGGIMKLCVYVIRHKFMENDEKSDKKTSSISVFGQLFQIKCPRVVEAHSWEGLGFDNIS
jgi:hypothetical protein